MDEYRARLRGAPVAHIAAVLEAGGEPGPYGDEEQVEVAGIVQSVRMKTTKNNTMMAYVTLEDDTGSIELLAFSNTLNQYGSFLAENMPVVVQGRISVRDEKAPQIILNRATPIDAYDPKLEPQAPRRQDGGGRKLYLRVASDTAPCLKKLTAVLHMFPGSMPVILLYADTRAVQGTTCLADDDLFHELRELLGEENVVIK